MWKEYEICRENQQTIDALNRLHEAGVPPEHIKISSSTFADTIIFFEPPINANFNLHCLNNEDTKVVVSYGLEPSHYSTALEPGREYFMGVGMSDIWIHNNILRRNNSSTGFPYSVGDKITDEMIKKLFNEALNV